MKEGYGLVIELKQIWKCKCGHRQDGVDGEEWPQHCGEGMSIGMTRQFLVESTKTNGLAE